MKNLETGNDVFDVIIVGGGTAGCVLAERLTASGHQRVLLLEAGGPPKNRFVSIPAGFTKLFKSECDWNFESEPQVSVGGRRIFTPRGKMLGGSSNMNAMMNQWCHPADFNGWLKAGATGWGWNEVAPIFAQQENWLGEEGELSRGRKGPMRIEPNTNARSISKLFVEAARRVGLGDEPYYNGHSYQGAWLAELATYRGKRFSVYNAYLQPAMSRKNLVVMDGFHATKILIDQNQAVGVTGIRKSKLHTFRAKKVVLAAGAYGSPQLLMLSGIGSAEVLKQHGLKVHVDAPEVGENLQDHPVLPIIFSTQSTDTLLRAESLGQVLSYLFRKKGMLASNGVEGFAFAKSPYSMIEAPDLEIMALPFEGSPDILEPPQQHGFTLGAAVVAPRSRGWVRLRNSDPLAPPVIDPQLLGDREGVDAAVLWHGVRLSRKIAATQPLSEFNNGELRPGEAVQTDQEFLSYANSILQTVYHPTSTCRMGSDFRSVVDPQLKVRGVTGLWVADASVMPTVPRGHPNAVVAMIAHRAANWIKEDRLA